ncbi:MAG: hypothetical protein ABWZ76_06820 [Acidimicrobiales bacterium]
MIAFVTALLMAIAGDVAVLLYSKRRKPGAPLSWGEAMAAAVFAFLIMNLWYGVVPHQWITLADNEWKWRSDRILHGPFNVFEPDRFQPLTITYQAMRDIVVTLIYGVALGLHVFHWAQWQDRAKVKPEIVPTTTYGRPLARKS